MKSLCEVSELLDQIKKLREKRDGYDLQVEEIQQEIDALEEKIYEMVDRKDERRIYE